MRLHHATAEGRLTAQELEERLETLFTARTYGEVDALLADLPVSSSPERPPVRVARWAGAAAATTLALAVLGMLAVVRERSVGVVGQRARQFGTDQFAGAHHAMFVAAARVAVFAVLLGCAALAWAFMRLRASSNR